MTNRAAHGAVEPGARTDSRLGHLVRLLTSNATVVVSGTRIAEELETSRSEVWRLVQQLRELGVEIAGHPANGYRLESMPDLLLPEIVAPLLKGTIFADHIHHYFRIDSTNLAAMHAAADGEREGAVFLAEEQTAGRGRAGRSWESEASAGIYCSVILRPQMGPAEVLTLSLMAGIAVVDAVREVTGLTPDLRWPNDALLNKRKFCGILTELNAEITRVRHAVIGIGIDVNQAQFAGELSDIATSLKIEAGRDWSRVELTAALLKSLDRRYRELLQPSGPQRMMRLFEENSSYARGKHVRVGEENAYEGVTEGLDGRGFLQVRTEQGIKTVISGDVREV